MKINLTCLIIRHINLINLLDSKYCTPKFYFLCFQWRRKDNFRYDIIPSIILHRHFLGLPGLFDVDIVKDKITISQVKSKYFIFAASIRI